mgnify:CR=1 FL=1
MAESPRPDLADIPLPLSPIPAGTHLFRLVRGEYKEEGALRFGASDDPAKRSRWYAPDASYGVGFFSFVERVCFLETPLRNPHQRFVSESELDNWLLVELELVEEIRVVELSGSGLRQIGCTASTISGPHKYTWPFSKALHDHPDDPDGIMHPSKMDPDDSAIALFDRARPALRIIGSVVPTDPHFEVTLASILHRYDVGLV